MNTVPCPNCGEQVELSEALMHQMREQVRNEEESKHKLDLEKATKEAEEKALKRAKEEKELELKNTQNELEEKDKRNKELQEQTLELSKLVRSLKQKDDEREIEKQKELAAQEEKVRIEERKKAVEEQRLKNLEKDKQLQDALKANDELRRKLEQGSQQSQGEALELDLEAQLKEQFPNDLISPVPKGIEGADITQRVRNKLGQTAGVIIWETKRTKSWGKDWSVKLREEKRKINASLAILVSDVLPNDIINFGLYENIWVCSQHYAIPLADVLRIGLFELAVAKSATANKDEKLEALFSYLISDGFRNRFESQVESIITLRNDLETERNSTIRLWKRREMQIKRLMNSVATMYGELQGVMGDALPTLPSLDSGLLLASKSEQDNLLE